MHINYLPPESPSTPSRRASATHLYATLFRQEQLCNQCAIAATTIRATPRTLPGACMNRKFVANRYGLPLFKISSCKTFGRIGVLCTSFSQAKNWKSVEWIRRVFPRFTTDGNGGRNKPKLIACDATYCINTPLRSVFPSSKVILDESHLHLNVSGMSIIYRDEEAAIILLSRCRGTC